MASNSGESGVGLSASEIAGLAQRGRLPALLDALSRAASNNVAASFTTSQGMYSNNPQYNSTFVNTKFSPMALEPLSLNRSSIQFTPATSLNVSTGTGEGAGSSSD